MGCRSTSGCTTLNLLFSYRLCSRSSMAHMPRRFVHFGGWPDPRHDSFVMGQGPAGNDLYITFDTPPSRYDGRVVTQVRATYLIRVRHASPTGQVHRALSANAGGGGEVFAQLRWFNVSAIGTFTSSTRRGEPHMQELVDIHGRPDGCVIPIYLPV